MVQPHGRTRTLLVTIVDLGLIVAAAATAVIVLGGRVRMDVGTARVSLQSPLNGLWTLAAFGVARLLVGRRLPPLPLWWNPSSAARFLAERDRAASPEPLPPHFARYAAAVALASLVWIAPHLRHPRLVPDAGDPLFSAWRLARLEHQLLHDPAHLFDGNAFYPLHYTLTYSDATFLEGLVALPFIAAGLDPLLVSNWLFFVSFPLSGLAFFYVGWRLTSDLRAGAIAGILGAWYPFHAEHYSHLELQYFWFVPLAMWTLMRAIAAPGWRTGLVFGLTVAAQWLACMYFGVMLMTFLVPFGLLVLAAWRIPLSRATAAAVCTAALPIVAGLLILGIPYMAARGQRGDRGVADLQVYSAVPQDYGRPHPRLTTERMILRKEHRAERDMFPGFTTVALGAAGMCPPFGVFQIAAIASGALAFDWSIGIHGLTYDDLFHYVLPYRGLRVPARFSAIVGSVLVLLAAYGCRRLLLLPRRETARWIAFAAVIAVALVDLRVEPGLHPYFDTMPSIYSRVTSDMVLAETPRTRPIDFQYFSTRHWAHLIDGYSGFMPIDEELEKAWNAFPFGGFDVLRRRGATHLTYNCAFEKTAGRCAHTLELLAANPALELVASERWQGAEVRLYRFR